VFRLVTAVLLLGNLQFDDKEHKANEGNPCLIKNKEILSTVIKSIDKNSVSVESLTKILLYEKKKFLK